MRSELNRLQRIEAFLLGQPTPAQAADWHLQTLLDPELAADAEAQQLAYRALQQAGRQQLRHELAAIHERLYGPRRSWWQAVWSWLSISPL